MADEREEEEEEEEERKKKNKIDIFAVVVFNSYEGYRNFSSSFAVK